MPKPSKKPAAALPPPRRTAWVLLVLSLVNLALLGALCVAEAVVAERHWLTTFLTYCPQQGFGLPAVALLVWAIVRRQGRAILCNLLALGLFVFPLLGLVLPSPWRDHTAGTPVRILTYNVARGTGDLARLPALIAQVRPDIVCLQEANTTQTHFLHPKLRAQFKGWHTVASGEVALFSRYPLRERHIYPMPQTGRVLLEAVVDVRGQPLTVLNAHLSTATLPALNQHARTLPTHMRDTAAVRAIQIHEILRHSRVPTPVVVTGDFNTPPRGMLYGRMSRQFQDAFRTAGLGTGYSYPARFPLWRIDYIWATPEIGIRNCFNPPAHSSDHRPLVADLVIPNISQ